MNHQKLGRPGSAAAVLAAIVLLPAAAAAQSATNGGAGVPRTAWGDPDLQGLWTSATLTPLERPARQSERTLLTAAEAAAIEQESAAERAASDGKSAPGTVGGYNQVWLDAGTRIVGDLRTSLIVDPPEGRIPWRPDARLASDRERARYGVGPFHSWTDSTPASAASPTACPTWSRSSRTT